MHKRRPSIEHQRRFQYCFPGLLICLLIFPAFVAANNTTTETAMAGGIIDSVRIDAENVFDLTQSKYDNFLFRIANKMHIVTRHSIIRRELLLGKGDYFDTALVNESERNLRQLPYLLKTDIRLERGENDENIMVVNTSDKWTTVGGISFHRTGGRNDLQVGVEENNLLGYGIFLSNDYMVLEDDRDYYQMEIGDHRVLGRKFSINLFYSDSPRAGQISLHLGRPFYTLDQKLGGAVRYSNLRRRLDYYVSELLVAQDRYRRNRLQAHVSCRIGAEHMKYHFTPRYEYLELDSLGMKLYDPAAETLLPPVTQDSTLHYFEYTFRIQQIKYAVYNRLNRFHKSEDINLGFDSRISYGTAFSTGFKDVIYDYYAVWPQYTAAVGSNLLILGFDFQAWQKHNRSIRRMLNLYFKGYRQYNNNMTLAIGLRYLSNRLENKSYTLYLDEDNGLRGYPAFIYNGEERLVMNIENRFFSNLEILSVGIGGVAFADIGNIWSRDAEPVLDGFHSAFGIGLRFGISRSTQGEVIRIDLAYAPDREKLQISVGTGQFF